MTNPNASVAYREPESTRAIHLAAAVLATALLMGLAAGCGPDVNEGSPVVTDQEVEHALRSSSLDGVPPEVAEVIELDIGEEAHIQDVEVTDTESGIIYRVLYIEDGQARRATYDRAGERIEEPAGRAAPPAGQREPEPMELEEPIEPSEPAPPGGQTPGTSGTPR